MLTGEPDPADVKKYFRALRSAQRDIDLRPERYTHYYRREFPQRFLEQMIPGAGARRAHRLRALHQGGVRGFLQVGPRAQDLRARAMGAGCYEEALFHLQGLIEAGNRCPSPACRISKITF